VSRILPSSTTQTSMASRSDVLERAIALVGSRPAGMFVCIPKVCCRLCVTQVDPKLCENVSDYFVDACFKKCSAAFLSSDRNAALHFCQVTEMQRCISVKLRREGFFCFAECTVFPRFLSSTVSWRHPVAVNSHTLHVALTLTKETVFPDNSFFKE
jgi:hypothetical protein